MRLKKPWQDWVFVAALVITVLVMISIFATYKHIPGPVYGGDLYRERGFVLHVTEGNPFWKDPYFKEHLEFYPPLGYVSLAMLKTFSGLDVNTVMNFSPIIVFILKSLALYMLGNTLFRNKTFALLLVLIGSVISPITVKVTLGLGTAFVFFALNYLIKVNKKHKRKDEILLGVFLGLALLSHLRTAIYSAVFVLSTIFFEFFMHKDKIGYLKDTFRRYILSFLIMVGISAVFYVPLLIKYQMKSLNLTQQYSLFDVTARGIEFFFMTTVKMFFNFSSVLAFVLGILALAGVVFAIMNFKRIERRYILWWILGAYLASNHYLITAPLFDTWIVPSHVFKAMFYPFAIFQAFGLYFLFSMIKKVKEKYYLIAVAILLVLPGFVIGMNNHLDKRWVEYGQSYDASLKAMDGLADWIDQNTDNDAVFLGNDESMFAINALSGRKVVLVRRTHASPYVDVDKRYADAMVMMYGNDLEKTKELIDQYGVTHLFVDSYTINTQMVTSLEHKEYLQKYGVEFSVKNVRLDISTANAPYYESLVVPRQNITMSDLAQPVYQVQSEGQVTGLILKITGQ